MALSVHLSAFRDGSVDDDDDGVDDDEYDDQEEEEERENASYVGYVVVDDDDEVLCGGTRSSIICIMSFNQIVSIRVLGNEGRCHRCVRENSSI